MKNSKSVLLSSLAIPALLTGCQLPTSLQAGNSAIDVLPLTQAETPAHTTPLVNPDATALSNAVCDPFGTTAVAGRDSGLHAKMYYLTHDQPRYSNVNDYLSHGHPVEADLYFNQLNVPTRPFDLGFMTQDGTVLSTPEGNTLYEYFGLHFESEVKLGRRDRPAHYQFATLSDDGSITRISDSLGTMRTLIDNNGTHASQLGCADETVEMTAETRLPIQLDYYQGPRYHIALMLLWREVPSCELHPSSRRSGSSLYEPACWQTGNSRFFDSTKNPSLASQLWLDMLGRGWKVLSSDNYALPHGSDPNPCRGSCFTDRFVHPSWNTFALSHDRVDPSTLKVNADGVDIPFTYDSTLNAVFIQGLPANSNEVHIGFCQGTSPSPIPSPIPSPMPSTRPSARPSPVPSPAPSPGCVGPTCFGGIIGA